MATITKINGRWRAQVRKPGHKSIARTFDTQREAVEWGRKTEAALTLGAARAPSDVTVADVVQEYRSLHESAGKPVSEQSNTHYVLNHLVEDLGESRLDELTPKRMAEWAAARGREGAGPATVNGELSLLGTVIRFAASALNAQLPDVVGQARPLLNHLELIGSPGRRSRRIMGDELARVVAWLEANKAPVYAEMVKVAAITGIRRTEMTKLRWDDLVPEKRAIWVRDRKSPRRMTRHDDLVPLLGDSWDLVQAQRGGDDERIFPAHPQTMSKYFHEATVALSIPDLRLHDLRREAGSALHDLGFSKEQRKAVLGHRSDTVHDRYIVVTPESLHERYQQAQEIPAPVQGTKPRPRRQRKDPGHQP